VLANAGRATLVGSLVLAMHSLAASEPVEQVSTQSDQRAVAVTIYNGDLALVHDRRRITFARGVNRLAWRDVSGSLDATSAIVRDLDDPRGLAVLEQNFDFSLLTPASLLAKYVGRDVTVVHEKPLPGRPMRERARVLANNDGVVLQYADRIETNLDDEHLSFPGLPGDLRERPTLLLDLEAADAGPQDVDLAYLSHGLGWHAEYVGVVSRDTRRMDLSGLVTLTNTSGTTFANAHLRLVAGNVNLANGLYAPNMTSDTYAPPAPTPPPLQEENYFEYHLYSLARPTTIANGQTKQVALLAAHGIPIHETLELRGAASYYSAQNADLGTNLPVGAYVTFVNKGGGLGIPLPGGLVRLYQADARGQSQFLGSDRIDHTPRNEDIRLHVGDSFDVTANRKRTDFTTFAGFVFRSSYELRIANAKAIAQDVDVVEPIPGTWSIEHENIPHVKSSSSTATWHVHVPADGSTTLTYTALVRPYAR
jgi:hypothetical protein